MDFISFASIHGLLINRLEPDSRIRRCGTEQKPRSNNGAYLYDGQRGWVYNWSGDAQVQWWNDPNAKPWTDQEKREYAQRRKQADHERNQGYAKAARDAQQVINSCTQETHPYLAGKGFPSEKGFVRGSTLYIPMRRAVTGELMGVQRIMPDQNGSWAKKMMPGMRSKGAVFQMGQGSAVMLCEGYATALSIFHAVKATHLRMAVVACFSANNMKDAAMAYESVGKQVFVFADNDKSGTGQRVAQEIGCPWVMSPQIGEDANDLHTRSGIFALASLIRSVRN